MHQKEDPAKKPRIPGAKGPKLWNNFGNVTSEEGSRVKNPRILGVVGLKCGKQRKFALEEGNSCEKTRILGVMGEKGRKLCTRKRPNSVKNQ